MITTAERPLPSAALVSERELAALNFYRLSELHGGLVLGTMARLTRDARLTRQLLRHAAEEVMHAELWTRAILRVRGRLHSVPATYQAYYARELGPPRSLLQVLALTQVFECRVFDHFSLHASRPHTHPIVRETLETMLEEEQGHLRWVREWLDREEERRPGSVTAVMARFEAADRRIYPRVLADYGWHPYVLSA
jgi:hypothetical protein